MTAGGTVYFHTKTGAHFGRLIATGPKWARVMVAGTPKRVPLADVHQWPPPPVEFTRSTGARRGR